MNNILEMIKNEKVEWKKLGDVCEIVRGVRVTKKELIENGNYPVVSGGVGYMGYINNYNRDEDTITIAQYGTAGYVKWQEKKFWANDVCFSVYPNDKINKRYLYHFLLDKQNYLYLISNKIAVPYSISKNNILNIKIPLPSIKTQEKIVEILDDFVKYSTELQVELQSRSSQYEYFRDLVLSEDYLNKLSNNLQNNQYKLRYTTLGEIGEFINGSGMPKTMFNKKGEVGAIHYGHIYTKYSIFVDEPIVKVSKNDAEKLKKVNYGDLVIAKTSENIDDVMKTIAYIGNKEVVTGGHAAIFKHKENPKYLSYLFNGSSSFLKQKNKLANGVKVIEISIEEMKRIKILLPPLEIQNKVVEVLDKFQNLISDAEGLLPEEIEQRQKQYEYYREKLLTFENNMVQVKSSSTL